MKIVCSGCGAQHLLSDMQLSNGGCNVVCPRCSTQVYVDASQIDPSSTMPRWYYAYNDDSVGPLSTQDLEFSFQNGQVTPDTYVWCDGLSDWMPLSAVAELSYFQSVVQGTYPGEDEATRVAGADGGGYAGFTPAAQALGETGEETAAIDISEFESQLGGGFSPFDSNGPSGIVGMDGQAAVEEEPQQQQQIDLVKQAAPSDNDMAGAHSESSVLFSLSSLQAVGTPGSSGGESGGGASPAPAAGRNGLIDVKALASASPAPRRRNQEVASFSGAGMPMATVLPLGSKKDNTKLYVILGVVGFVIVGLIVAVLIIVLNSTKPGGPIQQQALNENDVRMAANDDLGIEPSKKADDSKPDDKKADDKKADDASDKKVEGKEDADSKEDDAKEDDASDKKGEKKSGKKGSKKKDSGDSGANAAPAADPAPKPAEKKPAPKKETAPPPAAAGGDGLTKAEIQGVIRGAFASVRACSRGSAQKGQMNVSFVIKGNGSVSNAKVTSPQFANTPTATCVIKVVNGMKFRAVGKDTPINNFPFQIQ